VRILFSEEGFMKKATLLLLSLSAVLWVSCGGGGGGGGTPPPAAVSISISPTSSTVGGGSTAQFTATVRNTTNTAVTWQVEGVTGGNATAGTISTGGLYTAPLEIPAGGTVTVTAVSQADTTKSASANVTIVFSNAMLSGRYAFSYTGWDPGLFYFAGSFLANGSGTITSGVADLNSYDVFPAITVTGTYSMNADGRVVILLSDSLGYDYTLRAVMISPDHLRVIQFDSPATYPQDGATGQGVIDKQDPASFSNAAFAGGYAFRLDGPGFGGCTAGFAGRMTADAVGGIADGVMDVNECGDDYNAVAFTGSYYDLDATTGRGRATLDTGLGSMNFAFYIVSANKVHLISLDLYPWTLGFAERQTLGTFSNANITGSYAFFTTGYSQTGLYYNAGRFTANGAGGAVTAGVSDENDGGVTLENLAFTGTYSVAANGRGTGSFTSDRGTSDFSFYMISPARAVFVEQGTFAVATGELDAQSGSFSTGSLAGDYGMSLDGYPDMIIGQFSATGGGAASGTVDISTFDEGNGVFDLSPDQAFTATYSVTANGRGNYTVSGTTPLTFHIYMVSGSKANIIGMSDMFLGVAEKQF
jgi:hypothetical protein